ncbi:MAG: pseudouridine synthase, partial [Clostridiales bacterium]
KRRADCALVEITIHEGRNRQVRRMLEAIDCPVIHLKRIGLAFLDLSDVPIGKWRDLTVGEVSRLKSL